MEEVWYLAITLFVLEPNGEIDGRRLYSTRQDDHMTCRIEADARTKMFTRYIGKDHIERPSLDETYIVQLNGTLVGFSIGCEPREQPNISEKYRKRK